MVLRPPRRPVPCCTSLPLACMPSSLPRRNPWVLVSLASPETTAFPEIRAGRLPHYPFRGLLDVYSRYGLHTRRATKVAIYTEELFSRTPCTAAPIATGWSDSCRMGFAPTGRPCLCTAHRMMRVKAHGCCASGAGVVSRRQERPAAIAAARNLPRPRGYPLDPVLPADDPGTDAGSQSTLCPVCSAGGAL